MKLCDDAAVTQHSSISLLSHYQDLSPLSLEHAKKHSFTVSLDGILHIRQTVKGIRSIVTVSGLYRLISIPPDVLSIAQ